MNHSLILNALVVILIGIAMFLTGDPMVLMCLFFLQDMPYGLLAQEDPDEIEQEQSKPMRFIQ